jgi:hypothetical protein
MLFQTLHNVDDSRLLRLLGSEVHLASPVFELGLDQFLDCLSVGVGHLLWFKATFFAFDQLLGHSDRLRVGVGAKTSKKSLGSRS